MKPVPIKSASYLLNHTAWMNFQPNILNAKWGFDKEVAGVTCFKNLRFSHMRQAYLLCVDGI